MRARSEYHYLGDDVSVTIELEPPEFFDWKVVLNRQGQLVDAPAKATSVRFSYRGMATLYLKMFPIHPDGTFSSDSIGIGLHGQDPDFPRLPDRIRTAFHRYTQAAPNLLERFRQSQLDHLNWWENEIVAHLLDQGR